MDRLANFSVLKLQQECDSVTLEKELVCILWLRNRVPTITFSSIENEQNANVYGLLDYIITQRSK